MGVNIENLKAVTIQVYKRLAYDRVTAPAAFGVAASVIQQLLRCPMAVACDLLEEWLKEAGL